MKIPFTVRVCLLILGGLCLVASIEQYNIAGIDGDNRYLVTYHDWEQGVMKVWVASTGRNWFSEYLPYYKAQIHRAQAKLYVVWGMRGEKSRVEDGSESEEEFVDTGEPLPRARVLRAMWQCSGLDIKTLRLLELELHDLEATDQKTIDEGLLSQPHRGSPHTLALWRPGLLAVDQQNDKDWEIIVGLDFYQVAEELAQAASEHVVGVEFRSKGETGEHRIIVTFRASAEDASEGDTEQLQGGVDGGERANAGGLERGRDQALPT